MKRITIRDFILNSEHVRICNTGHITNGHWALSLEMMPKIFQNYVGKLIDKNFTPDFQNILDSMKDEIFYEIFPVEEKDFEDDNLETIVFQPKDKSFQIGFHLPYILYLRKIFPTLQLKTNLKGSKGEFPTILEIRKGLLINKEIGFLIAKRF